MRTVTVSQLNALVCQAFERWEKHLHPDDPEAIPWPFYAPLDREKEEKRCAEGCQLARAQMEENPIESYRLLLTYVLFYWVEWFILRDRIDGEKRQEEPDLHFLSELGREVKRMGFQLEKGVNYSGRGMTSQ